VSQELCDDSFYSRLSSTNLSTYSERIDEHRTIMDMDADGNCLFRALSDQLYWDFGSMHADIRSDISDYLEAFEEDFSSFLVLEDEDEDAADFDSYIHNMRQDGEWGGNLELVAAARLYW
jgi:hypothetical protein